MNPECARGEEGDVTAGRKSEQGRKATKEEGQVSMGMYREKWEQGNEDGSNRIVRSRGEGGKQVKRQADRGSRSICVLFRFMYF